MVAKHYTWTRKYHFYYMNENHFHPIMKLVELC